jgi:uncharacterized membrane protein
MVATSRLRRDVESGSFGGNAVFAVRRHRVSQRETIMTSAHIITGVGESVADPVVRKIGTADIKDALARGIDDFRAMPSHAVFLVLIYPLVGFFLARMVVGSDVLPLLFPIVAGFALVGPFAALGLYEMSRRREEGLDVSWHHALDVRFSPSFGAIVTLGLLLFAVFGIWVAVAQGLYVATLGYQAAAARTDFLGQLFTTNAGLLLILAGNGIGFLFALLVLTLSVVTFPLLLDRDVGAARAVLTSIRVVRENPGTMALWGLIVAALLVIGMLPFFLGLAVVMPILGHATWHLYRKAVAPDPRAHVEIQVPPKPKRYAADFPAALFSSVRDDKTP